MYHIRQVSSTSYPIPIYMVDSTDHVTPKTGLTLTVTLSKNNGTFAAAAGAVTEIGSGWYSLAGNATDRNTLGSLLVHVTGAVADPFDTAYSIVPFDPYDGVRLGLTALPNAAAAATGGLATVDASNAVKVQSGTAANQISLAAGLVTVGTNNDKTGYGVSSAAVQAIWDALTSALTTSGSIGSALVEAYALLGRHTVTRNTVYSGGNLLTYDIRVYTSAANANTDDGATGLLASFGVTNTYDGLGQLTKSTMVRN